MEELKFKELVAQNLIKYRKANHLTQLDVAEKLNYSDKAVSKWERGESTPDVYTLQAIASLYGVSLDALCTDTEVPVTPKQNTRITKIFIAAISSGLSWVIATLIYIIFTLVPAISFKNEWLVLVYAVPVFFIVLTVFAEMWFSLITRAISVTGIVFGIAVSIHLSLSVNASINRAWVIYVLAGVLEVLVILWYIMFRFKRKK